MFIMITIIVHDGTLKWHSRGRRFDPDYLTVKFWGGGEIAKPRIIDKPHFLPQCLEVGFIYDLGFDEIVTPQILLEVVGIEPATS